MINKIRNFISSISKKGFFHLLSANLVLQVAGFASQFFVAGFLDPIELGRIKIMQSIIQVFVILAGLGLNSSVLKLCSENKGEQEKNSIYVVGLSITFLATVITYLLLFTLAWFGLLSQDDAVNSAMLFFALTIIPIALNSYQTAFFQSLKRIKDVANIQVTTKLIAVILVIILTYYYSLYGFLVASFFGFSLTTIYFLYRSKDNVFGGYRYVKKFRTFASFTQKHLYYAKYSSLANFSGQLAILLDIFLLNHFIEDRSAIGQYAFALTLILILDLFLSTIQQVSTPYFSGLENDRKLLLLTFNKYQRIIITFALLLPILVYFFMYTIVPLLFGSKYDEALKLLPILLGCWSVRSLYALKGVVFFGAGFVRLSSILSIINLVSSMLILSIGVGYNIYGVAIAKLMSFVLAYIIVSSTFYYMFYCRK